jgi:hypothetical protein
LSRSLRVSTCLGVNCASGDTKLTLAGTAKSAPSNTIRAADPDRYAHGLFGGEINLHVDFGQVDDRQHLSARRNDFPGVDETIQNTPLHGRHKNGVGDLGVGLINQGLCGHHRTLARGHSPLRGVENGARRIAFALRLIAVVLTDRPR